MNALLLALVLQAPTLGDGALRRLAHPARAVREAAIAEVAAGPWKTATLLGYLAHDDARVACAVADVFRRRHDAGALAALARCADGAGAVRGEAAAHALVAIAARRRVDLASLHFEGMQRLPARMSAAMERAVERRIAALGGPHLDRPQDYRPLFCGGAYAARALRRLARDGSRSERARTHALYASTLLEGRAAEPLLLELMDDPAGWVRVACAAMLSRVGRRASLELLARRLDGGRLLVEGEMQWIVAAAGRTKVLSDRGAGRLRRLVLHGITSRALGAAAALRQTRPAEFRRVVEARLVRMLGYDRKTPGAGTEAALFEFRVGPLEPALKQRMRASADPLVRAAATPGGDEGLSLLAPMIAPLKPLGRREWVRAQLVFSLLERFRARPAQRLRFARSAIDSQLLATRRYALWSLRPVPRALLQPLVARIRRLLSDRDESVRLAAAALLAPDADALRVLISALYDGRPSSARAVRRVLERVRPAWPRVDPTAPVAQRRRLALRLMARNRTVARDKD